MRQGIFFWACLVLLSPQMIAAQKTITVGWAAGCDYSTIQAAIDAATTGETVVVYPGTYVENILFKGRNITLRNSNPSDSLMVDVTILDGGCKGSVVTFAGTETASCVLSGLTIRNGYAAAGAGIYGAGTHALIEGNKIKGNSAFGIGNPRGGGGGGLYDCDGVIRNNLISANSVSAYYYCFGGGLSGCDGIIQNNVILHNQVVGYAEPTCGGGLYDCNGTIENNIITHNSASANLKAYALASGGGLSNCDGTIRNNVIVGNQTSGQGGGLHDCRATVENNTIVGNSTSGAPWHHIAGGGGLYGCSGRILNCIVWGNRVWLNNPAKDPQLYDCTTPTCCCIERWAGKGLGNISADPIFVDPDGADNDPNTYDDNEYHLSPGSPCINAGDPAADLNDGCLPPGLGTVRSDIGAYGGPHNGGWPRFDLTGTLSGFSPSPILGGQAVNLSGRIVNQGPLPFTGRAWVEFWAVHRSGWRGYLCDSIIVGPLGPGEFFNLSNIVPGRIAYENILPGAYTIEMRLDATNACVELNESNNISCCSPAVILPDRPNLVARGFDFSPESVLSSGNQPILFSGVVENSGSRPITDSFWVEFHISLPDAYWPWGSYLCESWLVTQQLDPGESVNLASLSRVTLPIDPGTYIAGIILDVGGAVFEQREDDNQTWLTQKRLYVRPRPTAVSAWKLYR